MAKQIEFSFKRSRAGVIQRNSDAVIESRKRKSIELLALLKQGKKIIYVDGTGFHRGVIPIYGYSKTGEPLIFSRKSLSTNFTAIAAISQHTIIDYRIFQGGVKAESFASFLVSLVESNPDIRHNLDDWVLYMDNALTLLRNFWTLEILFPKTTAPSRNEQPSDDFECFEPD